MAVFEKNLKIFGGGLMVTIIALIFLSVHTQNAAVSSADEFLALLDQGKYTEAREVSSEEFKNIVTVEQLQQLLEETPEIDMADVDWQSKEIKKHESSSEAYLYGTAMTPGGEEFAVELYLEKLHEEDEWKVLGIFFPDMSWDDTSFLEDSTQVPTPDAAAREQMALGTMNLIFEGVKTDNFTVFYESMAEPVKITSSPESFLDTFAGFVTDNPQFLDVQEKATFELDEEVDRATSGILVMQGRYLLNDIKFEITFQYAHEANGWKLLYVYIEPGTPIE